MSAKRRGLLSILLNSFGFGILMPLIGAVLFLASLLVTMIFKGGWDFSGLVENLLVFLLLGYFFGAVGAALTGMIVGIAASCGSRRLYVLAGVSGAMATLLTAVIASPSDDYLSAYMWLILWVAFAGAAAAAQVRRPRRRSSSSSG